MALCDGLYSHLEGHNVVCRSQSLRVLRSISCWARDNSWWDASTSMSHILQIQNDIAAYILSQVDGTHIKIAGVLVGIGGRASFSSVWNKRTHTPVPRGTHAHIRSLFQNLL